MRRAIAIVAVVAALSTLFCSCGSAPAATADDNEKIRELADVLGEDLKDRILPEMKKPDNLAKYDYVVARKAHSVGTDALAMFFGDYKSGSDCEITMIFANDSFVVARVVFSDGKGYYLRYEYDKDNPKSFEINGQVISDVDLKYQESPPKWTFTLHSGKTQRAEFKFVSPV